MPRLNRRAAYIEAGLRVAEYGLEHLSFTNVGMLCGVGYGAVAHQFDNTDELRAAVIELARQRRNVFVLGQLRAMRPMPGDLVFARLGGGGR